MWKSTPRVTPHTHLQRTHRIDEVKAVLDDDGNTLARGRRCLWYHEEGRGNGGDEETKAKR